MDELPIDAQERIFGTLGKAVAKLWSALPHDMQQQLFEAAVSSEGESVRQRLAVFLHGKHSRTTDAVKARAVPEPDSKGG